MKNTFHKINILPGFVEIITLLKKNTYFVIIFYVMFPKTNLYIYI